MSQNAGPQLSGSAGSFFEKLSVQQVMAGDVHMPAFRHTGDAEGARCVVHGVNTVGIDDAVVNIPGNFREFQRERDFFHINPLGQGEVLCLRSGDDLFRFCDCRFVNVGRVRMFEDPEMDVVVQNTALHMRDIFPDFLRSGTVDRFREFQNSGFDVEIGIPQQFCQKPCPHLGHVRADRLIVSFFIDAAYPVLYKEPHVRTENLEVREGKPEVAVVGDVVPDVDPVTDSAPADQIFLEAGITGLCTEPESSGHFAAGFKRMRKAAFDGTETDTDVVTRLDELRRFAGVHIRQRIDDHVGKFLFDCLGDLIHKRDHGACLAFIFGINLCAFRASTGIPPVILGNRDDSCRRIGAEFFSDILGHDLQYVRVRQAKLGLLPDAFAADHGEVFRMFVKIHVGTAQVVERMDVQRVSVADAAVPAVGTGAVQTVSCAPLRTDQRSIVQLAVFQCGLIRIDQVFKFDGFPFRDFCHIMGIEPDTQKIFQQGINAVHDPLTGAAADGQTTVTAAAYYKLFFFQMFVNDKMNRRTFAAFRDFKLCTGHAPQDVGQIAGSCFDFLRSIRTDHDRQAGGSVIRYLQFTHVYTSVESFFCLYFKFFMRFCQFSFWFLFVS